jgi:multiple sugar transport system permease protein
MAALHPGHPAPDEAGDPGRAAVPHLDAFRIFDNIFILTAGANNTRSVSILGYDNLFTALNLGVGSTISVLIFIAVAIIAFVFVKGFGTAAPGQEVDRR